MWKSPEDVSPWERGSGVNSLNAQGQPCSLITHGGPVLQYNIPQRRMRHLRPRLTTEHCGYERRYGTTTRPLLSHLTCCIVRRDTLQPVSWYRHCTKRNNPALLYGTNLSINFLASKHTTFWIHLVQRRDSKPSKRAEMVFAPVQYTSSLHIQ